MSKAKDYLNKMLDEITTVEKVGTETEMYAARMRPLGITGYGNTEDGAREKVKRMFAWVAINHLDRDGLKSITSLTK
jgi:hypothetical protein